MEISRRPAARGRADDARRRAAFRRRDRVGGGAHAPVVTVIDNQGRLGGVVNVLDAAAIAVVALALAFGAWTYRSVRGASVHIASVTPHQIAPGERPSAQPHGA